MEIFMIWARDMKYGHMWLLDAWDSDSMEDNHSGWLEAQAKHKEIEQEENMEVRVIRTTVDFGGVRAAFEAPVVSSGPVEVVED